MPKNTLVSRKAFRAIASNAGYTQVPREAIDAFEEVLEDVLRERCGMLRITAKRTRMSVQEAILLGKGL